MHIYPIEFEIHGDFAMFANPATGGDAVSYPAPTFSAAKGMFESIAYIPSAKIVPYRVHICRPLQFTRHSYNCTTSDLRKDDLKKKGHALQRREIILTDVVYQFFADIEHCNGVILSEKAKKHEHTNSVHALQDIFTRRVAASRTHSHLYLGRKECVPTYFGPCVETTVPDHNVNLVVDQMLRHPFAEDQNSTSVTARYNQSVLIEQGVLNYA